jgi:two-component system chemotaxis response regulator CheB
MSQNDPIKVLVVDDSALIRQVLTQGLNLDPGITVVGSASDPFVARDMIVQLKPDVLTLDVEMPRMDGVEFLRRLMPQYPIPVIMVSALTEKGKEITLGALDAGAIDFVTKPKSDINNGLNLLMRELRTKIKIASTADVSHWKNRRPVAPRKASAVAEKALAESTDKVIAIGASTGGTEALRIVLSSLPPNAPGIVIVQHMPPGFTGMFAQRLNKQCAMIVKEAQTGDRIHDGVCLIAPGDRHMRVVRQGGIYTTICQGTEPVGNHCPSVEVLFQSVAKNVGRNAIGVMLTGMGRDGHTGMLAMRKAGAYNIGQDEQSSVVYGMPKEAYEIGAINRVLSLNEIGEWIMRTVRKKSQS